MIKRIKQFYINLTDRYGEKDDLFVRSILDDYEYSLFSKLSGSEKKHSVRVANEIKRISREKNISDTLLIKAALLHDIGKSRKRINIIDKSIIVILHSITSGKLRNINTAKVQCYYNHSEYSYDMLKDYEDNERLLYIIKNHHRDISDDEEMMIFQFADDKS